MNTSSRHVLSIALIVLAAACAAIRRPRPTGRRCPDSNRPQPTTVAGASSTQPRLDRATRMDRPRSVAPGAGNDSLATAPRVANVTVTVDQETHGIEGEVESGALIRSVQTDANGQFQTTTVPAGDYVITFVPPAGSAYAGVYAFGHLSQSSSNYPWWLCYRRNRAVTRRRRARRRHECPGRWRAGHRR